MFISPSDFSSMSYFLSHTFVALLFQQTTCLGPKSFGVGKTPDCVICSTSDQPTKPASHRGSPTKIVGLHSPTQKRINQRGKRRRKRRRRRPPNGSRDYLIAKVTWWIYGPDNEKLSTLLEWCHHHHQASLNFQLWQAISNCLLSYVSQCTSVSILPMFPDLGRAGDGAWACAFRQNLWFSEWYVLLMPLQCEWVEMCTSFCAISAYV